MSECRQFREGSRKRAICEGMANLSLEKINAYRERWGLRQLSEKPVGADAVPGSAPGRLVLGNTHPRMRKEKGDVEKSVRHKKPQRKFLGDRVEEALSAVGITEERITRLIGKPCGCSGRKQKLNKLHAWAEKKLGGLFNNNEEAVQDLESSLKRSLSK